MGELDTYDIELIEFCNRFGLPSPDEYLHMFKATEKTSISCSDQLFFGGALIGVDSDDLDLGTVSAKEMLEIIKQDLDGIVRTPENISIYQMGDSHFEIYFQNDKLRASSGSVYLQKQKAFAIIDDKTKKDYDLILSVDGITPVARNTIRDTVNYGSVVYSANGNKSELMLGYPDVYASKDVDIVGLKGIADKLAEYTLGVR